VFFRESILRPRRETGTDTLFQVTVEIFIGIILGSIGRNEEKFDVLPVGIKPFGDLFAVVYLELPNGVYQIISVPDDVYGIVDGFSS